MILTPTIQPYFDMIKDAADEQNLDSLIIAVTLTYWTGYNQREKEHLEELERGILKYENGESLPTPNISDIEIIKYLKTKFVDEKKYDLAARMRDCEKILRQIPKTVAEVDAILKAPPAGEELKID